MSLKNPLLLNKVVAVVGPTGSGKTTLGSLLARECNGVIISADSRQIYRGLDVGTNKEGQLGEWQGESARFLDDIPQLLVDVADPGERFTLHDWLSEARRLREKIAKHGQLPIVVGGTGLYVSALLDGYVVGTGRHSTARHDPGFSSLVLMTEIDRAKLYDRSDKRFEKIFDALVNETEMLLARGVSHTWLQTIGLDYRFASYYLTRTMNRELAISQFQQASRRYIRRQLTWWRHHNSPKLVRTTSEALELVKEFA